MGTQIDYSNVAALQEACRKGVLAAFEHLVQRHQRMLFNMAFRIPAARQNELLQGLQRLDRITVRPAPPPAGAELLELTIQW